eukprot:scaffold54410_cov46-Prasinocladus_malaysianus.AAC.1
MSSRRGLPPLEVDTGDPPAGRRARDSARERLRQSPHQEQHLADRTNRPGRHEGRDGARIGDEASIVSAKVLIVVLVSVVYVGSKGGRRGDRTFWAIG